MIRKIRPLFYSDIADQVAWLSENADEGVSQCWAEAVWATLDELGTSPFLGRHRPDLPFPGVRSWRIKDFPRWLIFYGLKAEAIIFYRVRHGATNLIRLSFET